MPTIRLAGCVLACIAGGAVASSPVWTVEAPSSSGSGFIAYGVVTARNDVNSPTGQILADAVDFFSSPFLVGEETVDFGGGTDLVASDSDEDSGCEISLGLFTTIDGADSASVVVRLHASGEAARFGASAFRGSADPNNRAAFALRVANAANDRPVRVSIAWSHAVEINVPAPHGASASMHADIRLGREGDLFLPIGVTHIGADESDAPLLTTGESTLVIAPDDFARAVLLQSATQCIVEFTGQTGVPGPSEAGAFTSELTYTISLRQFCPGDTDGDDLVNFADLNTVVGSFNATGAVGEHAGDINGDGVVDFADLNMTLTNFGQSGC